MHHSFIRDPHNSHHALACERDSAGCGCSVKDIIHEPTDEFAVVRVVGDPDVVFSGVHATLQVRLTETPARHAVVLERAHDGVDQLTLQASAISQVSLVIVQRVVQVRHRTICIY